MMRQKVCNMSQSKYNTKGDTYSTQMDTEPASQSAIPSKLEVYTDVTQSAQRAKHKPNRNRSHTVTIRMNKDEYDMLQKKLQESGQTQQSFIVNAIQDAPIIPPEQLNALKAIAANYADIDKQIQGVARNLNQQTRNMNLLIDLLQDAPMKPDKIHQVSSDLPTVDNLEGYAQWLATYRKEVNEQWQYLRQSVARQKATRD